MSFLFGRRNKETADERRLREDTEELRKGLPLASWAENKKSFIVPVSTQYGPLRVLFEFPPNYPQSRFTAKPLSPVVHPWMDAEGYFSKAPPLASWFPTSPGPSALAVVTTLLHQLSLDPPVPQSVARPTPSPSFPAAPHGQTPAAGQGQGLYPSARLPVPGARPTQPQQQQQQGVPMGRVSSSPPPQPPRPSVSPRASTSSTARQHQQQMQQGPPKRTPTPPRPPTPRLPPKVLERMPIEDLRAMDNSHDRILAFALAHPTLQPFASRTAAASDAAGAAAADLKEAKSASAAASNRLSAAESAFSEREARIAALLARYKAVQSVLSPKEVAQRLLAEADRLDAEAEELLAQARSALRHSGSAAASRAGAASPGVGTGHDEQQLGDLETELGAIGSPGGPPAGPGSAGLVGGLMDAKSGGGAMLTSLPQVVTRYTQIKKAAHIARAKADRIEATYAAAASAQQNGVGQSSAAAGPPSMPRRPAATGVGGGSSFQHQNGW